MGSSLSGQDDGGLSRNFTDQEVRAAVLFRHTILLRMEEKV